LTCLINIGLDKSGYYDVINNFSNYWIKLEIIFMQYVNYLIMFDVND